MRVGSLMIAAAVALVGCIPSATYVYTPRDATTWLDGYPARHEAIPPEQPHGGIEAMSLGLASLSTASGPVLGLHARLVIENDDDQQTWQLDTRDQLLELPGGGRSRAAYVNSDVQTVPIITINRRDRRVVDLYYTVPAGLGQPAGFDVLWSVRAGEREVGGRMHFDRIETDPYGYYGYGGWSWGWGWAPYWWYAPYYSDPYYYYPYHYPVHVHGGVHVHGPGVVVHGHGGHVSGGHIHSAPPPAPRPMVRDHRH